MLLYGRIYQVNSRKSKFDILVLNNGIYWSKFKNACEQITNALSTNTAVGISVRFDTSWWDMRSFQAFNVEATEHACFTLDEAAFERAKEVAQRLHCSMRNDFTSIEPGMIHINFVLKGNFLPAQVSWRADPRSVIYRLQNTYPEVFK